MHRREKLIRAHAVLVVFDLRNGTSKRVEVLDQWRVVMLCSLFGGEFLSAGILAVGN